MKVDTVKVKAGDAVKSMEMTISVAVTGMRLARARIKVGTWLMKFGGYIVGMGHVKITEDGNAIEDAARWRFVAPHLARQLRADGEMYLLVGDVRLPTGSHGDFVDKLVTLAVDGAIERKAVADKART